MQGQTDLFAIIKKRGKGALRKRREILQKFQQFGWGNQNNNVQANLNKNNKNHSNLLANTLNGLQWVAEMQNNMGKIVPFHLNDMKKFIDDQIEFLEPSPHQKKLQQLKKKGQVFKDDRFKPNLKSLTGEWGFINDWQDIQWKPISKVIPNAKIFQGKIQPGDIVQGSFGDCYFLAALAALAQRPDRIFNLFLISQLNEQKYYAVKMLYKGKWVTIYLDEYLPFEYDLPAFTGARQNELWVVLLEKAWAKMYTSYKRIEVGYPDEGLHNLTGAPIKYIFFRAPSFKQKQKQQWEYLIDASQRQYAMVSSTSGGSDTQKSDQGVFQGHAYTFLKATVLNCKDNTKHRIVQLRNPWGKGEFTGDWSDYDVNKKHWGNVDQAQKKRVGYNPDKNDGIFFMSWEDYCKQFQYMTIAEIDDNASYIYKSHKDPQNRGCYFKVTIHKAGNYSFHVDKTPKRSYEHSVQSQFTYPLAEIEIGKLNGNSVFGKSGTDSSWRTLQFEDDFDAGVYIVFVKIHYEKKFEKDFDVNLACYAEFPCEIALASKGEAVAFSGNPNVEWNGKEIKSKGAWNQLVGYGQSPQSNGQQKKQKKKKGEGNKNHGARNFEKKEQRSEEGSEDEK